jgi:acyl dehydratase
VRAGSEVRARVTLLSARESPELVDAAFLIQIENGQPEGQGVHSELPPKPCCVAEWLVRYYAQPAFR